MKTFSKFLTLIVAFALLTPSFSFAQTSGFGYGGDPVSCVMTANPDTIEAGGGTTLSWTLSENVVSAVLSPKNSTSWQQDVALDGSWYISGIADSREYTLTVVGAEGQEATCDASITVEDAVVMPPTCVINANPDTIAPNGATTLIWDSSDNVVSAKLHSQGSMSWFQSVPVDGSWYISDIADSRAYSLTVENSNGDTYTCDAPITVEEPVVGGEAPTCTLTLNPDTILEGGGTTLIWEGSDNVVSAKLSPEGSDSFFAEVTPDGSWYISGITNTRGYTVTVFTEDGQESTCSAQVEVLPALAA